MEPDSDREIRVGFWPRLMAYLLDTLAVWTLAMVLQRPLAGLFPAAVAAMIQEQTSRAGSEVTVGPFLEWAARLGVAMALLAPFYGVIEALRGWSPGKLVMGLRIVTEKGEKPPLGTLLVRHAIKGAAAVITFAALLTELRGLHVLAQAAGWATAVGCVLIFSPARMTMHDRIAGTTVMRKADVRVAAGANRVTS